MNAPGQAPKAGHDAEPHITENPPDPKCPYCDAQPVRFHVRMNDIPGTGLAAVFVWCKDCDRMLPVHIGPAVGQVRRPDSRIVDPRLDRQTPFTRADRT